ncbi:sulfatase [Olivibacter ginsenosidimutans]|uniref:Sulfatase n=1 Tax=Olivibacter ginsenosidimutans TaxID=1176537 RepID=A0ABP9CCD8_9SPHI
MNRSHLFITLFVCFFLLIPVQHILAQQKQPNIILVLADDMGYSDLGCYGNPAIATPFLDAMASAGLRATHYVVTSPSCTPSRASLLTGRYASRYNLPDPIGPGSPLGLPDEEVTLAEVLHNAGYRTAMIGKWHLGDKQDYHYPTAQGFDSFYGMLYSHDYRDPYVKTDTTIKIYRNRTPEIQRPADSALSRIYNDEAIKFIHSQNGKQPFFLYYAHNMPHLPVAFAAEAKRMKDMQNAGPLGAVVEDLDAHLAALWKALETQGLADNTLFIFSSDNGPWIEYPVRMGGDGATKHWHAGTAGMFRGSKAQTYEGGVREPFIVYWKGHIPAGKTIRSAISNVDLLPTLAVWAQATLPQDRELDGQSIAPLLTGEVADTNYPHRPIYLVNHGKLEAVKVGNWKYREVEAGINNNSGKPYEAAKELFNVAYDPSERTNVLQEYPEKTKELKAIFDAFDAYAVDGKN